MNMPIKLPRGWIAMVLAALAMAGCGSSQPPSSAADDIAGGVGGQPAPQSLAYETYDAIVPVIDGPAEDRVANIDTRLYVPANASPDAPQPVIIVAHGFGNSKLAVELTSTADHLARNGYIVLTYSSQGFGQSSGCIRLNSFDHGVKNVMGLISTMFDTPEFEIGGIALFPLVARDGIGPLVGMIGGSYGGGITLNTAASDPRVRAIVPGRTWNTLQYALVPNNRITADNNDGFDRDVLEQGVFKLGWTTLLFSLGNAQPAMGNGGCPQEKAESGDPTMVAGAACPGFPSELCQTYAGLLATGDLQQTDRALVANSSIETRIDELRTPTMLAQGQADTLFNLNEATANYLKLKANNVPVAMIWHWGGHGAYNPQPGECELYGGTIAEVPDGCYLPTRALAWFDRWLRGNTQTDTGPEFAWYEDWQPFDGSASAESQYGQAVAYPVATPQRLFLSGADALVAAAGDVVADSVNLTNPVGGMPASYSETPNFQSPEAMPSFSATPPTDPAGQAVSFTAAPFETAVEVVGIPTAQFNLSNINAAQDVVLFAKLFDVAPDGSAELIRRLVAPVRVPPGDLAAPVAMQLAGIVHRFEAGHSVRLTLATTDQSYGGNTLADVITVATGGDTPAYLDLPVR